MKVLVITGSAHKHGTTAMLAENLIKGAAETGHDIFRFDAAFQTIHPCIACEKCHRTDSGCIFQDDMQKLNPKLLDADAVVFISPNDAALHKHKKTALMITMADDTMESAQGAIASFKGMASFLEWEIVGIIAGVSCADIEALEKTDYPKQAYELGKNL